MIKKLILTYICSFFILTGSAQAEFDDIPVEIKFIIAKGLSAKYLLTFGLLSKQNYEIANHESLWKNRILLDFGANIGLIAEEFRNDAIKVGQFLSYKEFYKKSSLDPKNYLNPILYVIEDRITQKKYSISVRYTYGEPILGSHLVSYDSNDLNMRDNFITDNLGDKTYTLRRNDFKRGAPHAIFLAAISYHNIHPFKPTSYIKKDGYNDEEIPGGKTPHEKFDIEPYSYVVWRLDESETHLFVKQIIYKNYLRIADTDENSPSKIPY